MLFDYTLLVDSSKIFFGIPRIHGSCLVLRSGGSWVVRARGRCGSETNSLGIKVSVGLENRVFLNFQNRERVPLQF